MGSFKIYCTEILDKYAKIIVIDKRVILNNPEKLKELKQYLITNHLYENKPTTFKTTLKFGNDIVPQIDTDNIFLEQYDLNINIETDCKDCIYRFSFHLMSECKNTYRPELKGEYVQNEE